MSTMTFGKYKGQAFEEVPASYLLWLESQDKDRLAMYQYIHDNRDRLTKEAAKEKEEYEANKQDDIPF